MKQLTQDVFKDAPDWVESAAIDSYGDAYLYSVYAWELTQDSAHHHMNSYDREYKDCWLGDGYDTTDWQNSAIDRAN